MKTTELKRLQFNRDYFEKGCKCIHTGTLKKLNSDIDNLFAVDYYETFCNCSRNYTKNSKPFQDSESLRLTGRSSSAIDSLPQRSFYVINHTASKYHYKQMCHELGRNDVTIISLRELLMREKWRGCDIYIDHHVFETVTGRERDELLNLISHGVIRGIYENINS